MDPRGVLLAGLIIAGGAMAAAADDPVLQIVTNSTRTLSRSELQKQIAPAELTVYSPVYQRPMTYQGFWLDQILGVLKIDLGEQDVVFESSDGYGTSLSPDEIGRGKWLVAYGEPQGWTPLPERNKPTLPGPWYVVGRYPGSYKDFPWPYQVTTIKIRGDW